MDPSALIFVALAVAWAVYLLPKALEHHEAAERGRSISSFSHRVRVLGRREAVDSRSTALVTKTAPAPAAAAERAAKPARTSPVRTSGATRRSAQVAIKRRRRVLGVLLLLLAATVTTAALGRISITAVAVPVVLIAAWLVACRLMVRTERAAPVRRPAAPASTDAHPQSQPDAEPVAADHSGGPHGGGEAPDEVVDSGVDRWDPVSVPLPTYVNKPAAAHRTVRTIDLDGTGVWSSGRNEADSALAREAEAVRHSEPMQRADRKTGS